MVLEEFIYSFLVFFLSYCSQYHKVGYSTILSIFLRTFIDHFIQVKVKGHPRIDHEGSEGEWKALERMVGQRHTPAALPPVKTRYPLYRRLGGHQGRSGLVQKISPPTRIRSPDRQPRSESLY